MCGEKVFLAELRPGDAELLTEWQWDDVFAINISYDAYHPFQAEDWERMFENTGSDEKFYFTIRAIEDERFIGFISLSEVMFKNRNAELGIGIPLKENRGNGYGKEALELMLQFAFNHLGLHKVKLSVHSFNTNAIKLYESLGFIREGINREGVFEMGEWHDQYNYGLMQKEWRKINLC